MNGPLGDHDYRTLEGLADDALLTTQQAATYLQIHARTVGEFISTGKLKGVRLPISTGLRVRVDELRNFRETHSLPKNNIVASMRAQARAR